MQSPNVTSSYIQDQKHDSKSSRFVTITPSDIGMRLADHGFELANLRSGVARKIENSSHQTTVARYRQNTELKIGGHNLDIVFKVPHLNGSVQAFLGTFRQVCSNGLVVGTKFFDAPRIRHSGDALDQISSLVETLVSKHDQLVDNIKFLQSKDVTPNGLSEFIKQAVTLRLPETEGVTYQNVQYQDLLTIRRSEDIGKDAYSILNVVEENLSRYGFSYQTLTLGENGQEVVRNMNARPLTMRRGQEVENSKAVDIKSQLWDLANQYLAA